MGGAIKKCRVGNLQRQLSGLPKKSRREVKQTLFRPQHRWQLTAILLCVPKRQEGDLGYMYEDNVDDLMSVICDSNSGSTTVMVVAG